MEQFDPMITDKIVQQLKSQGIFDQFRKECLSDVDTKPAYQNLRQRVDGTVSEFLSTYTWRKDLNKNQLRDTLRKYIQNSGFLDLGVERIVDQVVNPKIYPLFLPKVEEIVYDSIGVHKPGAPEKVAKSFENVSSFHSVAEDFQENKEKSVKNGNPIKMKPLTISETCLLPSDLEPVSPASEGKLMDTVQNEDNVEDEEISPPFEPHTDGNSDNSHESGLLELNSFIEYKSKLETVNCDVQYHKNPTRVLKSENIQLKLESIQEELVSDDDSSVKVIGFNEKRSKIKTKKSHKTLKNKRVHDNLLKKTSKKSDSTDSSSVEPETSTASSLGPDYVSDEIISSQEKDSVTNKVAKVKLKVQENNQTDRNNESSKKTYSDLKTNKSFPHHKKLSSSSSKTSERDHHSHQKHDVRKSSSHSSKHKYSENNKSDEMKYINKREKDHKKHERHEKNELGHKIKNKCEKVKYVEVKAGSQIQTKAETESTNVNFLVKDHKDKQKEIHSDLKGNDDSKRENTHVEGKLNKHHRSNKCYSTFKKVGHSWHGSELSISGTNIKDVKKPLERDKKHEMSKVKHSTKHCKSNEKFREERKSSDRDSNGQGEGTSTMDTAVYSYSQSSQVLEKDNVSLSSDDDIVCDSVEKVDLGYSTSKSSDKNQIERKNTREESVSLTLKSSIKNKHANVYEARKKTQARKSLERIRKKRITDLEQKVNKNTGLYGDSFDIKRRKITSEEQNDVDIYRKVSSRENDNSPNIEVISLDTSTDADEVESNKSENAVKCHRKNTFSNVLDTAMENNPLPKHKIFKKVPSIFLSKNNYVNDLNRQDNLDHQSTLKTQSKRELSVNERINDQENERDIMIVDENVGNQDFALVKLNSADDISITAMQSDLKSNIPIIRSVHEIKKSLEKTPNYDLKVNYKKSHAHVKKKEKFKRKISHIHHSDVVVSSDQEHSNVHSNSSRQSKILKVINQDVRHENRFEDFASPEKDLKYSGQVLEDDLFSQAYNTSQTDTEEYSPSKPPKLATKLMDVALQDLLMESGLSSARPTIEHQDRRNTSPQFGRSNTKRLKLATEKTSTSHQQHYDKSDLYKPRPRFTQSSKRTRRTEEESHDDSAVKSSDSDHPSSKT